MIKQEIDYLIKNTVNKEQMKTLCISELDYLNLCTIKKRSKMKVYKGFNIFYHDKINVGSSYLLPFTVNEIKQRMLI
jgi:hypothetical protein